MSMNKTWAISSWISFLISADISNARCKRAGSDHSHFWASRRADKIRQSRLGRSRLTYSHTSDMACHIKTTLNIDDTVMNRLRREAARQRKTMSELVEAGLRLLFHSASQPKKKKLRPLPTWHGGKPRVDIADRNALYDFMEGRR